MKDLEIDDNIPTPEDLEVDDQGNPINKGDENKGDENADDIDDNSNIDTDLDDKDDDTTTAQVGILYNYLAENEILDKGEKVESLEDLEKAFRKREDTAISRYKEELPEDLKGRIEAFEKGIPFEESVTGNKTISTLKSITEEALKDKSVAKQVIRLYLEAQGDTAEYIEDQLSLLEDTDRLFKESLRAKNALLRKEEEQAKAKESATIEKAREQKAKAKEYADRLVGYIDDEKAFWGVEVPKEVRKKVKESILDPSKVKGKETLDEAMKKDASILPQIQLLYELGVFGEKGNLDFLVKPAKTKATLDLNKVLNDKNSSIAGKFKGETVEINVGFLEKVKNNLRGK